MLLSEVPVEDIQQAASSLLAEAITRLRNQQVIREAGYDGEYGVIRLFDDEELRQQSVSTSLFTDHPPAPPASKRTAEETTVHQEVEARPTTVAMTAPPPSATSPGI